MSYFQLRNDVYLVKGIMQHLLYDLKNGNLISLSNFTRKLIELVHIEENVLSLLEANDKQILQNLIDVGILIPADKPTRLLDIKTLKASCPIDLYVA